MATRTKTPERTLPASLDAERYTLGSILINGALIREVSEIVVEKDFSTENHRRIFRAIAGLDADGEVIDRLTVAARLEQMGLLKAIGGVSYLVSLDDGLPEIQNVAAYCRVVKRHSALRAIIYTSQVAQDDAFEAAKDPEEIVSGIDERLHRIERRLQPNDTALTLGEYISSVGGGFETLTQPDNQAISTGWPQVDELLYGFKPGRLYVVGADTGHGKSSLVTQAMTQAALANHPVLYFTLEMPRSELWQRILCCQADVSLYRVTRGQASTSERYKLQAMGEKLAYYPLRIDDTAGLTWDDFYSRTHKAIREYGTELVALDYVQILDWQSGRNRFRDIREAMMYITRSMKMMAKELKIPVIAISQLSRLRSRRPGKDSRPKLSDLKESSTFEQDADAVLFIYRREFDEPGVKEHQGKAEVIIGKHRGGPTGTVRMRFDGSRTRFEEIPKEGPD